MAHLSASYAFADGDVVTVSVEVENDYPDSLSEGIVTVGKMLREAMVSGIVAQDDEDE